MKSNLYTRTGDEGTTSLVDGLRARKNCARIEAYGDVDELTSTLGFLAASKDCPEEIGTEIRHIQNLMFEIGGYLATPVKAGENSRLEGMPEEVEKLEGWIDSLDERTPKIRSFILPGGSEESARAHLARTVCRRTERKIITLAEAEYVDPEVIRYINRLSDYLFAVARYLNFLAGVEDIAWEKRK